MKLFELFDSPMGKMSLEVLRWGIFAFVATVIDRSSVLLGTVEQTPSVETMTIILRFADAVLHKSGVAIKGITRF